LFFKKNIVCDPILSQPDNLHQHAMFI